MTRKLLSMLVFTMLVVNMSAQESRLSAPVQQRTILQFNDFLASLRGGTARAANTQANRVKSLVKDSQPAVYLLPGGEVRVYGESPVSFFTDAQSLSAVNGASGFSKDNIEIVTIRINSAAELSTGIDLSSFSSFPNLKYVYIQSNVNVTSENLLGAIQHDNPAYYVFYDWTKVN